ncbi:unnamed protein product [Pieris macdunnoughi]|uniref:Uncharacterized protein n=1 Tax=Pieris macdunnoughi TaxID=345717 RepID=A0A821TKJ1_9NEOP|nr:unnamed protein product [Pieris macdunnoughi]
MPVAIWMENSIQSLGERRKREKPDMQTRETAEGRVVHRSYEEAKSAQVRNWREFYSKQGMWDSIYRIKRMEKKKRGHAIHGGSHLTEESAKLLAQTLFPDDTTGGKNDDYRSTGLPKSLAGEVVVMSVYSIQILFC